MSADLLMLAPHIVNWAWLWASRPQQCHQNSYTTLRACLLPFRASALWIQWANYINDGILPYHQNTHCVHLFIIYTHIFCLPSSQKRFSVSHSPPPPSHSNNAMGQATFCKCFSPFFKSHWMMMVAKGSGYIYTGGSNRKQNLSIHCAKKRLLLLT